MFTNPDTVYDVRRSQMQDLLAEAQRDRLVREAAVDRAPRPLILAALRRAVGAWLVGIGERLEGVSSVPDAGSEAVTA